MVESNNGNMISDPHLYDRLSAPHKDIEAAKNNFDAFYEEVCALREKYSIPEVVVAFGANALDENGKEVFLSSEGYRGGQHTHYLVLKVLAKIPFGECILEMINEFSCVMSKYKLDSKR